MPEERDIEKLLRAYGKKRQEQAPEQLHPATRRLLLAEVRRKYPQDGSQPASAVWFGWWKQLAWVGGLCGALALTIYVVAVREPPTLAKAEPSPGPADEGALTKTKAEATSAPAPEAPALQLSQDADVTRSRALNEAVFQAVDEPAAQAPPPVVAQNDEFRVALKSEKLADSKASASPAPPTLPPLARAEQPVQSAPLKTPARGVPSIALQEEARSSSPALAGAASYEKQYAGAELAALFTNQAEDKKLARRVAQVRQATVSASPLQSFRFVRSSNVVQLIDRDGSVYSGAFDASTPVLAGRPLAVGAALATSAPPVLAFQVMGTNATSGLRLTVRGIAQFDIAQGSVNLQFTPTTRPVDTARMLLPTRVDAQATLDDGRQLEIRAVRADP